MARFPAASLERGDLDIGQVIDHDPMLDLGDLAQDQRFRRGHRADGDPFDHVPAHGIGVGELRQEFADDHPVRIARER